MSTIEKLTIALTLVMVGIVAMLFGEAIAGGGHNDHDINITINNTYEPPQEPTVTDVTVNDDVYSDPIGYTTITSGVSRERLAEGIAMAGAGGGHQFDFSTQQWQLGVSGAYFDSESAISLGVAKRFSEESWIPNALFHGSYSDTGGSSQLITVGVTFRL